MSQGFDSFFDAYAAAFFRDDGVVVGAFDEPTVFFLPGFTVVYATHAELADALADEREALLARGVDALDWLSLEARAAGEGQYLVTLRWAHDEDLEVVYVLRGEPPDARITGIVAAR